MSVFENIPKQFPLVYLFMRKKKLLIIYMQVICVEGGVYGILLINQSLYSRLFLIESQVPHLTDEVEN